MHVVVATPCYGGHVTQIYMQSVCGLLAYGTQHGLDLSVELLGYDSLIPRARNTLLATFLDRTDATHLLFIDADIGFEASQVERMLDFGQDVVAGMYPLKIMHYGQAVMQRIGGGETLESAQLDYVGVLEPPAVRESWEGFATADFAGTGFMLISRSALDRMIQAFPQTRYAAAHNSAAPSRSPNQYALFDCMIEPDSREYLSEDYAFCHRWRSIGGKVWLDTRSRLIHVGQRDFAGDAGQRFREQAA